MFVPIYVHAVERYLCMPACVCNHEFMSLCVCVRARACVCVCVCVCKMPRTFAAVPFNDMPQGEEHESSRVLMTGRDLGDKQECP